MLTYADIGPSLLLFSTHVTVSARLHLPRYSLYFLDWYKSIDKSTNADAEGAAKLHLPGYSLYLLYWYKNTYRVC